MEEKRVSMGKLLEDLHGRPRFESVYERIEVVGVGAFAVAVRVTAPYRLTRQQQVLKVCTYDSPFQPQLEAINSYSISRMRDIDEFVRERTLEYYHTDSRLRVAVHDIPPNVLACIKAGDPNFLSLVKNGSVVVHVFEPMESGFKPLVHTLQRVIDTSGARDSVFVPNRTHDALEISDEHLRHALLQFLMLMARIQLHDPRMRHNDCVPNLFYKLGEPREVVYTNAKGAVVKFVSPVYIKLIDFGHSFTSMFNGEMRDITGEEYAFWVTPSMLANAMSISAFPEHDAFTLLYTVFNIVSNDTAFANTAAVIRRVCAPGCLTPGFSFDASASTNAVVLGRNANVFNGRLSTFPQSVLVPVIEMYGELKAREMATRLIHAIYSADADAVGRLLPHTDVARSLSQLFSTIVATPSTAQNVFQQQYSAGVFMKSLDKAIMETSFVS